MFPQDVFAEIAIEIAPDGVDVIPVVLRVVLLDQERVALHAVVVLLAAPGAAEQPRSSSPASSRSPLRSPIRTSAGSEPKKNGVFDTTRLATAVTGAERMYASRLLNTGRRWIPRLASGLYNWLMGVSTRGRRARIC